MVNDTTTLNGALTELGETMATNISAKGVTASASDGLTTLASKISQIQTGGGSCYNIELDNSAYTTTGSLTVSATLTSAYDDSAIVGATVTFTSSTSTTTTATTNSNGVATATISFSASTTLTATYSNVSDTATVTVQQGYLFYDDCSSASGLSNYGTPVNLYQSTPHTYSLSYDSTENAYAYYGSSNYDYYLFPIPLLDGESSFTLSAEFNMKNAGTSPYIGLAVMGDEADLSSVHPNVWRAKNNGSTTLQTRDDEIYRSGTGTKNWINNTVSSTNDWFRLKVTFNGTDGYSTTFETIDGTTIQTYTGTVNPSISDRQYGFYIDHTDTSSEILYIKNIKAERSV